MVLTASNMLPLGTKAPNFTLPDVITGKKITLSKIKSNKATVVMFICNHCPYVVHILDELVKFGNEYQDKGISCVAICSNDQTTHPDDAPVKMAEMAEEYGFEFPYCHDESQEVAQVYHAACTPDFYVFDGQLQLVYRGQFDDSRPGKKTKITGKDLRDAVTAVMEGRDPHPDQKPSMGCNIKWKD